MRNITRLLLIPAVLLAGHLYAQTCDCPEYQSLKEAYENSDAPASTFITKLRQINNPLCKAAAEEWLAYELMDSGNRDSALLVFRTAEQMYLQTKCGDAVLLKTYKDWAELYYRESDFAKAQEMSFKFLKAAETAREPYETGTACTMIAQLFNQTKQPEKGIIYARNAIPYLAKITDPAKKADLLFKLSKRYLWHYQDTKTTGSLDSSALFSQMQLNLVRPLNRRTSIAAAFNNLQGIAWEKGDLKQALSLADSSLFFTDLDDSDNRGVNYYDKADIYIELKDYNKAAIMADSCLYYYKKTGNTSFIAEAYELASRVHKEKGDFSKAYEYYLIADKITDSIRSVDQAKQVTELERKYSQAKNEKTIKELAQEKRIYVLLAAAGLFALIGLVLFIRQQSLKNKKKILETEQRLNRARMNPHFFFNALSSLQSFAMQGNDGKSIATNLSKFSHIMRETLESTYKDYVTIEQESDFLNEYLELQKIRFPQKFTYEIHLSPSIEPEETLIPSMILQPFAENSIEHGFTGLDYPGHITIRFEQKDKDLLVTITDNGKGLPSLPKENSEHISRASQIIKDRIYLLNIKLKTKAAFTIENNRGGKGVLVKITLPLIYKNS